MARKRNEVRWYPPWVYHINEDVTRRNMAAYDREQAERKKRLLSFCPEYYSLSFVERLEVNKEFDEEEKKR